MQDPVQEAPDVPIGTVTFLFTDIEGSTKLLETLGERYAGVLEAQRRILRAASARWNGREIDVLGDAAFVAFPRAMDALKGAVEAQRSLAAHEWPAGVQLRVRMGLHTGEPQISHGQPVAAEATSGDSQGARPAYIGIDVHRAARITSIGHGGQVLLSQTTRDLVYQDLPEGTSLRDLGSYRLKDIRHPQRIYQLDIAGFQNAFPPLRMQPEEAGPAALDELTPGVTPGRGEADIYRGLLSACRQQGRETLDKASLAMLLSAPDDLSLDRDDLELLFRSALKNDLSLGSCLKWAGSPQAAAAALGDLMQEYPPPKSRLAIIEALSGIPDPGVDPILLRVVTSDDAPAVRTGAALASAGRGQLEPVAQELTRQAREQSDPAVTAALAAVIDQYDLPEAAGSYPRLPVAYGLFQRRWIQGREVIRRRAVQGIIGGSLALGLIGASLPLLAAVVYPLVYEENRAVFSIPAWILSGAIAGMVWGGLQGLASCAAVCLADVFSPIRGTPVRRFLAGGAAGMVFTALMVLFASAGLLQPDAGPATFVPVFLAYGFLQGGALSWVIPRPGVSMPMRTLALQAVKSILFIWLVAVPSIYLVYHERSLSRLPIDGLYAILLSGGLAWATRRG